MKKKQFSVLIAVLNWGLGHATRCMPIIDQLLNAGVEIIIASDGRSLALLQKEYPQLSYLTLQSYQINYNSQDGRFVSTMLRQVPKIFYYIYQEHRQLQKIINQYDIDVVISDNRYGCWSKKAYAIFMTHQIFIRMPQRFRFLEPFLLRINQTFINRYNVCWIPDYPQSTQSLTGDLAHQQALPSEQYRFIGALSRFSPTLDIKMQKRYELLIIISGPEPQRTLFEKQLLEQVLPLKRSTLIVRGITETDKEESLNEWVNLVNHLDAKALNRAILAAEVVVSRAGYSTIMDLVALRKTAILVPTPEQTEQEYLADFFKQKKIFYTSPQHHFNLTKALEELPNYKGIQQQDQDLLSDAIDSILT